MAISVAHAYTELPYYLIKLNCMLLPRHASLCYSVFLNRVLQITGMKFYLSVNTRLKTQLLAEHPLIPSAMDPLLLLRRKEPMFIEHLLCIQLSIR